MTDTRVVKIAADVLICAAVAATMINMYSVKQSQQAVTEKVEELNEKIDNIGTLSATLDREILKIVVQLVQHGGLVMKDKDGNVVLEKQVTKSDNLKNGE